MRDLARRMGKQDQFHIRKSLDTGKRSVASMTRMPAGKNHASASAVRLTFGCFAPITLEEPLVDLGAGGIRPHSESHGFGVNVVK